MLPWFRYNPSALASARIPREWLPPSVPDVVRADQCYCDEVEDDRLCAFCEVK